MVESSERFLESVYLNQSISEVGRRDKQITMNVLAVYKLLRGRHLQVDFSFELRFSADPEGKIVGVTHRSINHK